MPKISKQIFQCEPIKFNTINIDSTLTQIDKKTEDVTKMLLRKYKFQKKKNWIKAINKR